MSPSPSIPLVCMHCAAQGDVPRVTAGLQCRCGSTDLDLWQNTPEQQSFVAQRRAQGQLLHRVSTLNPSFSETFTAHMVREAVQRENKTVHREGLAEGPQGPRRSPVGGDRPGWDEYTGPRPEVNPMSNGIGTPALCPVCHGSGFDLQEGQQCRMCGGQGFMTPNANEHEEVPLVARHPYPSTQTVIPFVGQRKALPAGQTSHVSLGEKRATSARKPRSHNPHINSHRMSGEGIGTRKAGRTSTDPLGSVEDYIRTTTPGYSDRGTEPGRQQPSAEGFYPRGQHSPAMHYREERDYSTPPTRPFTMPEAYCPNCGHEPTELRKDYKEDAWWTCPNCGPLANIDRHPEIDPYNPPADFEPNPRAYRQSKKMFAGKKTGRLFRVLTAVARTNPGLSVRDAMQVSRRTIGYAEVR